MPRESGSLFSAPVVTANIDGGARGNPGPAGYGALIRGANGEVLAELSEYLGHRTNNFAEYSALLATLEWAGKNGVQHLRVISDSELLVKQMNGEYKVKSPDLKELYDRAQQLRRRLARVEITHALREKNKDADRLANLAMDRGMGRTPSSNASAGTAIAPSSSATARRGIVKHGVVEFLGADLPEGTLVEVRPVCKG